MRDQDEEEHVPPGEPEPGEPVGHEDRRQRPRRSCSGARSRTCCAAAAGSSSWFQTVVKFSTSGENSQACSSVRQRPCHSIWRRVGSAGSTKMLDSRPGSTSISCARRRRRSGRCRAGTPRPRTSPVCGVAGQIGAPGVVDWHGCWNDVVTMYSSGSRKRADDDHARTSVSDALAEEAPVGSATTGLRSAIGTAGRGCAAPRHRSPPA